MAKSYQRRCHNDTANFKDLYWSRTSNIITNHAAENGPNSPMFLFLSLPHVHFPVEAPTDYYAR